MAEEETPENVQNQSTTPVRLPGTPSKPNLSSPKTTSGRIVFIPFSIHLNIKTRPLCRQSLAKSCNS